MIEVLSILIQRLPVLYTMIALPVFIGLAIWLLFHVKRDKQGKFFFYSKVYQLHKGKYKELQRLIEQHEYSDKKFRYNVEKQLKEIKDGQV